MPAASIATSVDEREPDHQRSRGRAGSLWVALRVLPREHPGRAAPARAGRADHGGERRDELRGEEGDAEEDAAACRRP